MIDGLAADYRSVVGARLQGRKLPKRTKGTLNAYKCTQTDTANLEGPPRPSWLADKVGTDWLGIVEIKFGRDTETV